MKFIITVLLLITMGVVFPQLIIEQYPDFVSAAKCDPTLWTHVYNSARLHIINECKSVTGTVMSVVKEGDGDYHIQLRLDSQFSNLLNNVNIQQQSGNLVIEPICMNPTTIAECQTFHQTLVIPSIGQHVNVTGSYVLDTNHGWNEIHPITSLNP